MKVDSMKNTGPVDDLEDVLHQGEASVTCTWHVRRSYMCN